MQFIKCSHFDNGVEIYANCCNRIYDCYLCHDENNDHTVKRSQLTDIICKKCRTKNGIVEECKNCHEKFGKKFCLTCKFWCNKIVSMYHCDKCNSCCIGKKEDYFHCDGCNICLKKNFKDNHKCHLIDKDGICPICLSNSLQGSSGTKILKCNHAIHMNCYETLIKSSSIGLAKCPTCRQLIYS